MATQQTSSMEPTPKPSVKTLLATDLVDSTARLDSCGDQRAAEIFELHDLAARQLLAKFNGLEIDRTDGFLLCFDRPIDAVLYALAYHDSLSKLSDEVHVPLTARAGIHLGEVLLRKNKPEFVARGAKAVEAEGLAKPVAARIMSLALGGQTLMTQAAFDLARRAAVGLEDLPKDIQWMDHGQYSFKGVDHPQAVCEVGRQGLAPLSAPPDSEKVKRAIAPGEEETLGWRPAVGLEIPGRSGWILQRKLGDGGFGEVWLAGHKKAYGQKAFKFCFQLDRLRGLKREFTLFRLMKEVLGDRSDIARLYEVQLDAPPFYLEMEYTAGGDLTEWANARGGIAAVPLDVRLELLAQMGVALAAAHSVGVIHKDVKPANVLIHEDRSGALQARLTDFGIGQLVSADVLAQAGITAMDPVDPKTLLAEVSSRAGTQLFMAPELLAGGTATIQSDVYALGILLFQMVVGDLVRPIAQGWEGLVDDELIREDITACIAGDPSERLLAADLLSKRLRTLEERRAERNLERRRHVQERRRRRLLRLTSAAAAVFTVVATVALVGYWRTELARRRAITAERSAESRRIEAETVTAFLADTLESLDPAEAQGDEITVREMLDRTAARIGTAFPGQSLVEATLRLTIGKTYHALGEYRAAEPHLRTALKLRKAQLGDDHLGVAEAMTGLGALLEDQGNYVAAESLFRAALATRDRLLGSEHELVAEGQTNLAIVLWRRGDYAAAESLWRDALAKRRALLGNEHELVAHSLSNLGAVLRDKGEYAEAESLWRESLALRRKLLGDKHPAVAESLNNLATLLTDKGEFAAAEQLFRETLAIHRSIHGEEHPDIARSLNNLASVLCQEGDYGAAEALVREAVAIQRKLVGVGQPDVSFMLNTLAQILVAKGDLETAEATLRESLDILLGTLPDDHWFTAHTRSRLGGCLSLQGQYEAAEPLVAESFPVIKRIRGPEDKYSLEALQRVIDLYELWGAPDEAAGYRKMLPTGKSD